MRNFSLYDISFIQSNDLINSFNVLSHIFMVGSINTPSSFLNEFKDHLSISHIDLTSIYPQFAKEKMIVCTDYQYNDYCKSKQLLLEHGFIENVNFFQIDIFKILYPLIKFNKLCLDRVEIFTTSFCSLNCKNCIAYIPYFIQRSHTPLDILINDMHLLFSKVDLVRKLKILGGEGLMYPWLTEYIHELFINYSQNVSKVCIGTNGTIIPSQKILDVCRKYGVTFDVSDYAQAVPGKSKMNELFKILEKNDIKYEIKRSGEYWLDVGFPVKPAHFNPVNDVREHFKKCAMFCRDFYDGKLWFCCNNFAAVKANLFPENDNDYIDFRKPITKQMIAEFELGFSKFGHTSFCTVCGGCSFESNPHKVPVAIQV